MAKYIKITVNHGLGIPWSLEERDRVVESHWKAGLVLQYVLLLLGISSGHVWERDACRAIFCERGDGS